jgi:hypothetical protein
LKSETDSLMARIRALTRTSPTALPPPREPAVAIRDLPAYDGPPRPPRLSPEFRRPPVSDDSDSDERPPPPARAPSAPAALPDALRLQQENVRLKAELLKTQKQLQAAQEENRSLASALEKNEQLRARYKQQIAALQGRH